jgi:uncharacterized protein (TIGR02145 family)
MIMRKTKLAIALIFMQVIFLLSNKVSAISISFTGSGASTVVDSVVVENITKSLHTKVLGSDSLVLTTSVGVDEISNPNQNLRIFPNPLTESSQLNFFVPKAGLVNVATFSTDGRLIGNSSEILSEGLNQCKISLPAGTFVIKISGQGFSYSAKAISSSYLFLYKLDFLGVNTHSDSHNYFKTPQILTNTLTYDTDDQLLFRAYSSGKFCTIVTDRPVASKSIDFQFIECKDADGNNYAVVKIGNQIWMAENLRATRFVNGDTIQYGFNSQTWLEWKPVQSTYNNDTTFKTLKLYGRFYNQSVLKSKYRLLPYGWHLPSQEDWSVLSSFAGTHSGGALRGDKALCSHFGWAKPYQSYPYKTSGVGVDLKTNNTLGLTILPAGFLGSTNSGSGYYYEGKTMWAVFWAGEWNWVHYKYADTVSDIMWSQSDPTCGLSIRGILDPMISVQLQNTTDALTIDSVLVSNVSKKTKVKLVGKTVVKLAPYQLADSTCFIYSYGDTISYNGYSNKRNSVIQIVPTQKDTLVKFSY